MGWSAFLMPPWVCSCQLSSFVMPSWVRLDDLGELIDCPIVRSAIVAYRAAGWPTLACQQL